jgi:cell division protein ZapA
MGHNKVKVEIYGNQYHLVSDDEPDQVKKLAAEVDGKMKEIASMNPGMSAAKVAILAALNFAGHTSGLEEFCNLFARRSDSLIRLISEELDDE